MHQFDLNSVQSIIYMTSYQLFSYGAWESLLLQRRQTSLLTGSLMVVMAIVCCAIKLHK